MALRRGNGQPRDGSNGVDASVDESVTSVVAAAQRRVTVLRDAHFHRVVMDRAWQAVVFVGTFVFLMSLFGGQVIHTSWAKLAGLLFVRTVHGRVLLFVWSCVCGREY
eukprot:m.152899 g.152899  ORF g.152899 m.152899 type:complete len:108 (-) comp17449_c0_seq2:94-417(-)